MLGTAQIHGPGFLMMDLMAAFSSGLVHPAAKHAATPAILSADDLAALNTRIAAAFGVQPRNYAGNANDAMMLVPDGWTIANTENGPGEYEVFLRPKHGSAPVFSTDKGLFYPLPVGICIVCLKRHLSGLYPA